jgi:hypothetical protein
MLHSVLDIEKLALAFDAISMLKLHAQPSAA